MNFQFVVALQFLIFSITPFIFEKSVPTDARDFRIDELGNMYLIHDAYVERINAVGNGKFRSSELNFGNIEYFDTTNPLKPFIFYRGIGKLVVFDNTLSQQGSAFDLFEKGFEQVELICGSRGDAYWMWDSRNSELIRVDGNFNRLNSSGNLSVLLSTKIIPVQIIERGKQLYIRDQNLGVFVFDIYGTYRTTLNIKTDKDIQVFEDDIIYSDDSHLFVLSGDWVSEQKMELPAPGSDRVFLYNQRLYCLSAGAIQIWKYSETTRN